MIVRKLVVTLGTLLLATGLCAAQSDSLATKKTRFVVKAQAWARGEVRDGALPSEGKADYSVFLMSNNVVRMDYTNPWLEVRFAPKYIGVWGSSSSGRVSIDEAWFGFRKNNWFARLGRQKLSYDDERVIGADDWVMAPLTHDVIKMGYEGNKHTLHLLLAFNQNDEDIDGGTYYVNGGQNYKAMQTLWYHYDPLPWLGFSLIGMNMGMQSMLDTEDDITIYQQLFGGYLNIHPKNFGLEASYYRQSGRDEYKMPIYAWMASAEASWQMHPSLKLQGGYFYMSGDKNYFVPPGGSIGMVRKTEIRGFNPMFGSHHKFYGAMDFFYVTTFYGGNSPGLQDLHIGASWNPIKKLGINGMVHYLATSANLDKVGKSLGHELEISLKWQFAKDASIQAGYTFMKGTETLTYLKRTTEKNVLRWGWLMFVVTPEFFRL